MPSVPIPPDQVRGYHSLDRVALAERMRERGVGTAEALAQRMNVKAETARRVIAGKQVQAGTLMKVCRALGVDDLRPLLSADSPLAATVDAALGGEENSLGVGEWRSAGRPTRWVTAANGLQYRTVLLVNRHLPAKKARGKQYDLASLSDQERTRSAESLRRHPEVCLRLEASPRFPVNLTTLPSADGESWWVVDQWVEGILLEERLLDGPLKGHALVDVAKQSLRAVGELHDQGVVCRELSPKSVWLSQDGGLLLTDFELGKLLDGSPTVSGQWQGANPYRAPEASAPDVDPRADLYSWGRLAAAGECPDRGDEVAALESVEIPDAVRRVVLKCLTPAPSKRPKSADAVRRKLDGWEAA